MKILWYNKNIDILLNELNLKKLQNLFQEGNIMIIDIELNEKNKNS